MRYLPIGILLVLSTLGGPVASANGQVILDIEINNTPAEDDDYIGWTPVRAQIRQRNGTADMAVNLTGAKINATTATGEVSFLPFSALPHTPVTAVFQDSLSVTLPADGTWKGFWLAGKAASSDGKDVKIVVRDAMNAERAALPLMVRVRKNAESLSDAEVNRFLVALAKMHDLDNAAGVGRASKYLKYVKAHKEAFSEGIHGSPLFTPWHRAMLLSFERELQSFDPAVALPYWKFDEPAPKLFSRKFMGVITSSSNIVRFDAGNPIRNWAMPSEAAMDAMTSLSSIPTSTEPMLRIDNADTVAPDVDFQSVIDEDSHTFMRSALENNYHNRAHSTIGGWLVSAASPRDPLFFLLHANVDRAWAAWQKEKSLFDPDGVDSVTYSPLGGYPGPVAPNRSHHGTYANDTVWPWNGAGGTQGTNDPLDDWPNYSFSMPAAFANHGPGNRVRNLIDYLDIRGKGTPHGYCYDKIGFK
ncbi:tyrosinase family protein [Tundrisphaera sp. TA3]|uniref:tyrosinase family protein n=1 Tax=Tundrisphaera sp. TA3 TaxID=3435775 RepID=UPI003EB88A73